MVIMAFIYSFTVVLYVHAPDVALQDKTIREQVEYWSDYYKINGDKLYKVLLCESRGKSDAIHYNDGGKGKHSVGVLQFQKSTFETWEDNLGEDLDYYSAYDQIKLASFMWNKGQQGQWTCYKLIK